MDTFDRRLRAGRAGLEHDVTGPTAAAGADPRRRPGRHRGRRDRACAGRPSRTPCPRASSGRRWPPPAGIRALTAVGQEKRRLRSSELRNADDKIVVRLELDEPDEVALRDGRRRSPCASCGATPTKRPGRPHGRWSVWGSGRPRGRVAADDDQGRTPVADRRAAGRNRAARVALGGFAHRHGRQPAWPARRRGHRVPARLPGRGAPHPGDPEDRPPRRCPTPCAATGSPPSSGSATSRPRCATSTSTSSSCPTMGGWLVAADAGRPGAVRHPPAPPAHAAAPGPGARACARQRYQRLVADWDAGARPSSAASDADRGDPTAGRAGRPQHPPGRTGGCVARRRGHLGRLAGRGPARAAQAVQGAALRARGVRPGDRQRDPQDARSRDLKDLQDVLGRFQDSEVQRQALREFAEEMMADGHPRRRPCSRWAS